MKNYELKPMWSCEVFFPALSFSLHRFKCFQPAERRSLHHPGVCSGDVREAKWITNPGTVSVKSASTVSCRFLM